MARNREAIKLLIELAESDAEADKILAEEFPSVEERYAFLRGAFDFDVPFADNGRADEVGPNYKAVLSAIVNRKWRA
ncbi:MAG: hypothetical protein MdMp014T_1463 [Treponematales bacterium]